MLKFKDVDKGTKLRVAFAILAAVNQAISLTPIPDFGNEYANLAYKIISVIISIAVLAWNTYYNNDFTPEAQVGTTATHILKADPTAVVDIYDGDEDDDEPNIEELDPEDNADETIEEGE